MTPIRSVYRLVPACCVTLAAIVAPQPAAIAEPARLVPADSTIYVGWRHLSGDPSRLHSAIQAILHSPLVASELGDELAAIRAAAEFARLAMQHEGAIAVMSLPSDSDEPPTAGMVLTGADPAEFAKAFEAILSAFGAEQDISSVTVGSTAFRRVAVEDELSLLWAASKSHFVLALGNASAERLLACINGAATLAEDAEFRRVLPKVEVDAGEWGLTAYANLGAVMNAVLRMDADDSSDSPNVNQLAAALHLDDLKGCVAHVGPSSYGAHGSLFLHIEQPDRGLARFWHQAPLSDDDLAIVPRDASYASVSNLDLAALWTALRGTLEDVEPDAIAQIDGGVAMATQFLGFSLTEQLLPALGDTWVLVDAPSHGGLLFTGMVLIAETRDAAALQGMLNRSIEVAAGPLAQAGIRLTRKSMTLDGRTIEHVLVGGWPVPVSPAWTFVGDRWIFGLFPQTVAAAARQVDPKTRGDSMADDPDFAAARALLPPKLTAVTYADSWFWHRLWYLVRQLGETAIASMSDGSPHALDLAGLPVYADLAGSARRQIGAYALDEEGVLYRSFAGDATMLALGGDGGLATAALLTSVALPSLSRAREVAKRAVSASNLKAVLIACHIYAADNGERFPESLEQLVAGGMIARESLASPRFEEGESPFEYIAGQKTSSDVRNVLIYERPLDSEGTNVGFIDGHVEWMTLPAFREAVRVTYNRLGRSAELPPEFLE